METRGELVAAGRARYAWRIAATSLLHAVVLGLLAGTVAAVANHDDSPFGYLLAVLALFAFGGFSAALYYGIGWALGPGRVRYVLDGPLLIAYRGRYRVREVDARRFHEIGIGGEASWRSLLLPGLGTISTPFTSLPRLGCAALQPAKPGRLLNESVAFPPVLVWGPDGAARIHDALVAALRRHEVTTSVSLRS